MVNTGSLLLLVCQGVTSTIIRIGEDLGTGGCSDILNSLEVISIFSFILIELKSLDILWDAILLSKLHQNIMKSVSLRTGQIHDKGKTI